ncbi:MAG: flagellum-specific ATP synthase FliI, partial [Rhodobacteraceae bacterium]|nr:flagellum-specific ATP synthase FliI [Paracoccaceae bacterium]
MSGIDWEGMARSAEPALWRAEGRIARLSARGAEAEGIECDAALGDSAEIRTRDGGRLRAEVAGLAPGACLLALDGAPGRVGLGDRVILADSPARWPDARWLGRVIDSTGRPLDGRPLPRGPAPRPLLAPPPPPGLRRGLGARLGTGLAVFDTLLPIVRGQRLGLFAGAGVGKSSLLADLARGLEADVVVLGLIGERGRELRHFVEEVLGPEGMARAVVVAATSDQPALSRRRAGWAAMCVAEY